MYSRPNGTTLGFRLVSQILAGSLWLVIVAGHIWSLWPMTIRDVFSDLQIAPVFHWKYPEDPSGGQKGLQDQGFHTRGDVNLPDEVQGGLVLACSDASAHTLWRAVGPSC